MHLINNSIAQFSTLWTERTFWKCIKNIEEFILISVYYIFFIKILGIQLHVSIICTFSLIFMVVCCSSSYHESSELVFRLCALIRFYELKKTSRIWSIARNRLEVGEKWLCLSWKWLSLAQLTEYTLMASYSPYRRL